MTFDRVCNAGAPTKKVGDMPKPERNRTGSVSVATKVSSDGKVRQREYRVVFGREGVTVTEKSKNPR
jgi:hypothetical protein